MLKRAYQGRNIILVTIKKGEKAERQMLKYFETKNYFYCYNLITDKSLGITYVYDNLSR